MLIHRDLSESNFAEDTDNILVINEAHQGVNVNQIQILIRD